MSKPRVVADIMTRDLITVHEEDNLQEVQSDMNIFRKRHLPVVDGDRLVGLLSHRDLLRMSTGSLERNSFMDAIDAERKGETFVAEVMTRDLVTTTPQTPLAEAARTLANSFHGCLPVVDEQDRLVGMVTEHDFVLLAARLLENDSSL